MARFSQGLLTGLGQPAILQDFRRIGAAIGSVPQQRQAQKVRQANAASLQGIDKTSPDYYLELARQAEAAGDMDKAANLARAAEEVGRRARAENIESAGRVARSKAVIGQLQSRLKDPSLSDEERTRTLDMLKAAAVAGEGAMALEGVVGQGDPYSHLTVVGNRVFNKKTNQYISPTEVANQLTASELSKVATPDSIVKYLQTGNRSDLRALSAETDEGEDGKEDRISKLISTDQVISQIDEALGLTEDVLPVTYDVAKFIPMTDARAMETLVTSLRSNLAFDRLQKMRDESKTGGALGQVSNIELKLLESSVAALDPASKNFAQQLAKVRENYTQFRAALLGDDPISPRYQRVDGDLYYESDDGKLYNLTDMDRRGVDALDALGIGG